MILYNVTVKIEKDSASEWLQWMREVHIPEVLQTGLFSEHRVCRILSDEADGVTYAVQYFCKDMEAFMEYQNNFSEALQADHSQRYKDRYVAFRTLMEVLS